MKSKICPNCYNLIPAETNICPRCKSKYEVVDKKLEEERKKKDQLAALSSEIERQADIYFKGFGVPKDTIMRLVAPHPKGLPEWLNIPIVTLGKSVDLMRQIEFAGIVNKCYMGRHPFADDHHGITFEQPHLIWMQCGTKYSYQIIHDVIVHLFHDENERPATISDGIAFAMVYPGFQAFLEQKRSITLFGTNIETTSSIPCIQYANDRPGIYTTDEWKKDFCLATCGG